jgi:glutaconyl-CoA/methylmalonyl-CoA decarboxylase subunit gamma
MQLSYKLYAGSNVLDRKLQLARLPAARAGSGRLEVQNGGESVQADWAEISPGSYSILWGRHSYDVRIEKQAGGPAADGTVYIVLVGARVYRLELRDPRRRRHSAASGAHEGPQEILAPMPGRIVKVLASENTEVQPGGSLLVIEAMKMQNEIRAPRAGRVEKIYVKEGEGVETGARLLRLV